MLKSFVVTLKEFLNFERKREVGSETEPLFYDGIEQYSIPLFQREYKWDEIRVNELIRDIKAHDKFLGMVILNKNKDGYDIVDGQQRITTIILLLAVLFNRAYKEGQNGVNREQKHILSFLVKNGELILKNESIGDWLQLVDGKFCLTISEDEAIDVYHQRATFKKCWENIKENLETLLSDKDFKNKLLSCEILVLICESLDPTCSPEQIFLDINDKLKPLDAEEIFKGHCFNICYNEYHDEIQSRWIKLKKNYFQIEDWGYGEFSNFIYQYILCLEGYDKVKRDLKVEGNHFLTNKTTDEIMKILDDMIEYSNNLSCLKKNLDRQSYIFEDLCIDAVKYKNIDFSRLKAMCKYIVEYKKDQYYKLPFMMLVNYLKKNEQLRNNMKLDTWRRIVTNYYVYAFSFINRVGKKDKQQIDRNIFKLLMKGESDTKKILEEVKRLRRENINQYGFPIKIKPEHSFALYSIMDNFESQKHDISEIYKYENDYTDEHFILNGNSKCTVQWTNHDSKKTITMNLKEELKNMNSKDFVDHTANHLVLPKKLNGDILKSYDVVTKIHLIEKYYESREDGNLPKHVKVFISYITNMEAYKKLDEFNKLDEIDGKKEEEIKVAYYNFVTEFFGEKSQEILRSLLKEELLNCFQN